MKRRQRRNKEQEDVSDQGKKKIHKENDRNVPVRSSFFAAKMVQETRGSGDIFFYEKSEFRFFSFVFTIKKI